MPAQLLRIVCGLAFLLGSVSHGYAEQSEVEFFEKKIRPVLVKHCYECHSAEADAVKGGLLLDSREGLLTGGDSGPSLVPGKPAESMLIESLKYESYEMPPSGKLSEEVIRDFEHWIQTGAIDPRQPTERKPQAGIDWEASRQFWAYQPLQHDEHQDLSTRHVIDHLLEERLSEAGLTANPSADPERLIRRLYYDLTGLPPSPDQVMEFLNDPTPQRWAETVDRLLATQEYGEHWGRHWLDVVRYADSNGNDFNATFHNAWRYRNYVIEAFKDDKPIDEFFREQLAGDLMPAESLEEQRNQLIATGFLMIGPKMLSERDKEKLEFDVVDEQIDSMGKVFLGLALGCARCHDHKFDPVPTSDYYALAGIFRGTQVLDGESQKYVSDWVRRELPVPTEQRKAWEAHQKQLSEVTSANKKLEKSIKKLEQELSALEESANSITIDTDQAELTGNWTESTYSPNFVGKGYIHDNQEKSLKTATFRATIPEAGTYRVLFGYPGSAGRDARVPVTIRQDGHESVVHVDQTKPAPIREIFFELTQLDCEKGQQVEVMISNAGTSGYVIVDAVRLVPVQSEAATPEVKAELTSLREKIDTFKKQLQDSEAELKTLKSDAPAPLPKAIAVKDVEGCDDCEILIRGDHLNKGEKVPRGVLKIISGEQSVIENPQGSGRLELAEWMTSEAVPLVARVYVNRVWMYLQGEGIVRSVDNFGALGIPPTHPELLDVLCLRFIESGWSTKQLIRDIVLTESYRRSTADDSASYAVDPENLLLWRSNRRPLTSEEIQDSLAIYRDSLNLEMIESTVSQFGTLVVNNSSSSKDAERSSYYAAYRSIYWPVLRSQLEDLRVLFDFANPEMVVGKRPPTNVPAQALFLMNHDLTRQTAGELVDRLFDEHGVGSFTILNDLYLSIYGRLPTPADDELARGYMTERLAGSAEPDDVRAAWTDYVQAMFASTEFRYLD
ncbi:DUF1549 domain-containing protein [Rubinisphaera margarita]|uniref:DUF1549 domain-containing protein n=1 Tax=Rubinisphaera margarita TaxID=2909586 RepID=UPI001EE8FA71|nr:DUF1549 domain-containing protein [Rubinisphaera margarita]MCG6158404.1 DUF1549 domain-containing protein [Rubinisphaera margarita]